MPLEVVGPHLQDDRTSTYTLRLPLRRARVVGVALSTAAPFVDRPYILRGIVDGRAVELGAARLGRAPLERRLGEPPPLRLDVVPTRVEELELTVVDGGDAPLALEAATAAIEQPILYLVAPDGEHRLLVGSARARAPRYEIENARALVLSARAADARIGALAANPLHARPARYRGDGWRAALLWAVLLFAVLVLTGLTSRLVRAEALEAAAERRHATAAPGPEGDRAAAADIAELEERNARHAPDEPSSRPPLTF